MRRLFCAVAAASLILCARPVRAQSYYPIGNVWPIGDSKTYGVADAPGGCAWRDPMYAWLHSVGGAYVGTQVGGYASAGGIMDPCPISGATLLSDGHNGYKYSDITAQVVGWYAGTAGMKVIVVYAGTNDILAQEAGTPGFTVDRLYSDFTTMMQTIMPLTATAKIIVTNVDNFAGLFGWQPINQLNQYVRSQVKGYQRQGKPVFLCDLYGNTQPTMDPTPGAQYNSGGVHQTVLGYSVTGAAIQHCLQTLQP